MVHHESCKILLKHVTKKTSVFWLIGYQDTFVLMMMPWLIMMAHHVMNLAKNGEPKIKAGEL